MLFRVEDQSPRLLGFSAEGGKLLLCLEQVVIEAVAEAARYCEVGHAQDPSPGEVLVPQDPVLRLRRMIGDAAFEQLPVLVGEVAEASGGLV